MIKEQKQMLQQAVRHHSSTTKKRDIWDTLFIKAFEGLVYPQIWEDPEADMLALNLSSKSRIIGIASGGCNMMSYHTACPERIDAVDINRHHVALNELKMAAIQHLPDYESFFKFFGHANLRENVKNYDTYIAPHLTLHTRAYWSGSSFPGFRRINGFQNNFYKFGLLGRLLRVVHTISKAYRKDIPKAFQDILNTDDPQKREEIFEREIGVLFSSRFVSWASKIPAMLYGLGIPPAQYESLVRAGDGDVAKTLYARVKKLAIGFPPEENYFAWQAFLLHYDTENKRAIPAYLREENYETIKANVKNQSIHHSNVIDFLKTCPDNDRDAYLFLDAQDWMSNDVKIALWQEVTRTARPSARVVFRTADFDSPLEDTLPQNILEQWEYDAELSEKVSNADRSAIYGASHVYIYKGE